MLRHAETDADLLICFPLMQDLRPHLADPATFIARVRRQQQAGYRLLAAWDGERPVGLAGYRPQENLIRGPFCYVDDLVVAPAGRRQGVGARLLDAVAAEARAAGLPHLVLDTGLDNGLGQRFYFRYGMLPAALRFAMPLKEAT
ncbi:GNAT family N-acetyltransferase [Rhodopila sp.]|jgi:ribosomal protein S18 acetylase RimI-like enzyme|uniref:GNAT family N-acetyltransferase n=1 Tax=Rhodopila sp. TaxID=2480087 RepID=UPI002CB48E7D|nr:GNAT family N-acetyltransferase [Rhodopila sp.]HVZ10571.1 GNAT family N-acetyltransferase [Rhodopila sp.]